MSLSQDFPWSSRSTVSSLIAVLGNLVYLGPRPSAPIYPIQTAGNNRRERSGFDVGFSAKDIKSVDDALTIITSYRTPSILRIPLSQRLSISSRPRSYGESQPKIIVSIDTATPTLRHQLSQYVLHDILARSN